MGATAAVPARKSGRSRTLTVRRPLVRPEIDHRRLVQAMRRWLVRRTFVLGLVLVALCIGHVWLRLQIVRVGYDISDSRAVEQRVEQERRELDLELAMLRDRTRLAERAMQRLGMRAPDKGQVVDLR